MAGPTRRLHDDRGVSAVEVAVVMPMMLMVILLVFQVALFWHAKQTADLAAEEAVESAQIENASEADGVNGAASVLTQTGNLRDVVVQVQRDEGTGLVTATVTGRAPTVVPIGTWSIASRADGAIEEYRSPNDRRDR